MLSRLYTLMRIARITCIYIEYWDLQVEVKTTLLSSNLATAWYSLVTL